MEAAESPTIELAAISEHLLLVERSATMRHVLRAWLERQGAAVTIASNFSSAVSKLDRSRTSRIKFTGIIIGWPTHHDPSVGDFLTLLNRGAFKDHDVLVMTHEAMPGIIDWINERDHSNYLFWSDYTKALDTMHQMRQDENAIPVARPKPNKSGTIRILLVDDSASIRKVYGKLLSSQGYLVDTAASVDEGMSKALAKSYDMAIIDYYMKKKTGDELVRMLKTDPATRNINSAILTATYVGEVITNALQSGATECMFKDESKELFLARIASMTRMILAQKSIETERQRLAGILSSVGDGVYGVDSSGSVTFINPAARQILGYDLNDTIIGHMALELFHSADAEGNPYAPGKCPLQQVYGTGEELKSWETVFWHKELRPIPIECTLFPLLIQGRQQGSVVAFRDISERRNLEQLRWQATHDPLTELINRRHFEELMNNELLRIKRSNETSALLYIDLDRFKFINDTAGHAAGDSLLIDTARKLSDRLRDSDILARLGGDEFVALLHNVDATNVYYVANSFRETLSRSTFSFEGQKFKVNGSVGVTIISNTTQSLEEALQNANVACHMAKRKGRNQTYVYVPETDAKSLDIFESGWSSRLRDALKNNQFMLCYQPIVPLDLIDLDMIDTVDTTDGSHPELWPLIKENHGGRILYEVLIRMIGPDNEIIPPNAFINSAERFDLMQEIDLWVISNATKKLVELDRKGQTVTFSVNLSSRTLEDDNILQMLKNLISGIEFNDSRLIFEITETSAITNVDAAQHFIEELKALGCRFALDDFGTGFSSFSYLRNLQVDFIKIDGQFVQNMTKDSIDSTMVTSMNDIAHSLGMVTIAEYVENAQILRQLKKCGVDYIQGNFVSHPICDL